MIVLQQSNAFFSRGEASPPLHAQHSVPQVLGGVINIVDNIVVFEIGAKPSPSGELWTWTPDLGPKIQDPDHQIRFGGIHRWMPPNCCSLPVSAQCPRAHVNCHVPSIAKYRATCQLPHTKCQVPVPRVTCRELFANVKCDCV